VRTGSYRNGWLLIQRIWRRRFPKVYLSSDGRYVGLLEGRAYYNPSKTIDTTYIIRRPFMTYVKHGTSGNMKFQNYPKQPVPQAYSDYRFLPIAPSVKPSVYKPIITPLTLPAEGDPFDLPTWDTEYDWDTVWGHEPYDEFFVDNVALFNSHQVIVALNYRPCRLNILLLRLVSYPYPYCFPREFCVERLFRNFVFVFVFALHNTCFTYTCTRSSRGTRWRQIDNWKSTGASMLVIP